jgi:N-acetylmuramoyl-L-alanine amidase
VVNIIQRLSPNFDQRAGMVAPDILILHYTGTKTLGEAEPYYLNTITDPNAGRIAPHYLIDMDGTVIQYVEEINRAWHAGKSWWAGAEDINSRSIGIEIVNPGHAGGCPPYTKAQMESLTALAQDIMTRNAMVPSAVLGHSDIAPSPDRQRPDPGEWMDWASLAAHGVGVWPAPEEQDYALGQIFLEDESALRQAFNTYGYDPRVDLPFIITAFQRHFEPEAFADQRVGVMGRESSGRLHWLLRTQRGPLLAF